MNKSIYAPALILGCAMLVGCAADTRKAAQPRYASRTDIDAEFAAGSGAAPTPRTLHAMADVLEAQGKDAEAHFVLERLIALYPNILPAYNDLAELHLRHDRYREARDVLGRGLALDPLDAVLTNNMGMSHLLHGNYTDAAEWFEKASHIDPANARYQANRALVRGLMGQYDEALEIYKTVLPTGEAHYNVAVICLSREDADRADTEIQMAREHGVDKPLRQPDQW